MEARDPLVGPDELATAIKRGDEHAEGLLYERYHAQLLVVLRGRGVPVGAREDIAHEAYIVTLQRLRAGELEDPARLGGFLKNTALNLWLNELRKRIRHGDVALEFVDEGVLKAEGDMVGAHAVSELADAILQLIGELNQERDRLVLVLAYVHDWDKQSICRHVGLDSRVYDNVRSRAIQRCRELLEKKPELRRYMERALED